MKTREIEVYRCWDDHTWDTDFVEIDARIILGSLEVPLAAEQATLKQLNGSADLPVMIGVYHEPEELEDEYDD